MKVSAPKVVTWWIAVILGILGVLGNAGVVAGLAGVSFWLVAAGLALLAIATITKGL